MLQGRSTIAVTPTYYCSQQLDQNSTSSLIDYFVVFTVSKESKELRLHVQSAYSKDEGLGKIKKVSFLVIANNLLTNKKLPKP
jgi:hypothetical protein